MDLSPTEFGCIRVAEISVCGECGYSTAVIGFWRNEHESKMVTPRKCFCIDCLINNLESEELQLIFRKVESLKRGKFDDKNNKFIIESEIDGLKFSHVFYLENELTTENVSQSVTEFEVHPSLTGVSEVFDSEGELVFQGSPYVDYAQNYIE